MKTTLGIPVIDISALPSEGTLAALDDACRDWGFFQVVGHGVAPAVTRDLLEAMRAFFHQDPASKQTLSRTAENPWGFYDRELTKNTPDWKEIFDVGPAEGSMVPQWPATLPAFRGAVEAYCRAAEALSFRLLAALSQNLGMPAEHLGAGFRPQHSSFLRLNYYPRCPRPERPPALAVPAAGHLGINHHTDAGALTVLFQDAQPGLEVYRHGDWHVIEPVDGALVINIGDIVQVWSNDRYRAALHRVLASADAERFSAPFFFNPAYTCEYAPLPSVVDDARPARYRPIEWREFRARRAAGDYADVGEEVQISHYRLEETA
jgi:isopenicillin N synthase-like dioxygenase